MAETADRYQTDTAPGSLITRDGQIQWAGLLMGPGTPYQIDRTGITGWDDLPVLDTGDIPRPDQHGSWPGARWAQPRLVGATVWLLPDSADRAHDVTAAFRAATGADGGEEWLAVRLHGETLAVRARLSRKVVPQDRSYVREGTTKTSLQWTATDPRRFGARLMRGEAALPVMEPGLFWQVPAGNGLEFPLDWGGAGVAGTLTAVNSGSAASHPVVEFRGPLRRPTLTRLSDGRQLQYDIVLGPQDVLTVDTEAGTVRLNGTTSRLYTATSASAPEQLFTLAPGETALAFRSNDTAPDPAASVTVLWRDSHW
ncbi:MULTISPECIES: phage distal tail protein [unclassified Streptomyces]|uniref:phage distal tail protein n=1 Tax=unclassified Streptomyces TaxID=2593676 RepID=UPI000DAF0260|nr:MULTISPECIES: phage tail protein [unclassified Streptomyces]PZT76039.1 phage tail protein [Streptomyces sp. AC1-42W]PZT80010.1 phage tail protein [Streptomyces sp. AC1-42T]